MELTDRHYRFLARLMTERALLFTEMLTANAVVHGDRNYLLGFNPAESPVALQLGGSDPAMMAEAAVIGSQWGYDEINMNVGCPSDRVQSGRFGACLMAEPELVAQCVASMRNAIDKPVTVKCRIGIDRNNSYRALRDFVETVADAGCERFYVHARKAWLDGLSPKENRDIPPLRYEFVYRLKQEMPHLEIIINGGITEWEDIRDHLSEVDGVMLGRQAYYHPSLLCDVDATVFQLGSGIKPAADIASLAAIARRYAEYMQGEFERGVPMTVMSRHLIALFQGVPGARNWRRHLGGQASKAQSAIELVEQSLQFVLSDADRSQSTRLPACVQNQNTDVGN